MQKKIVMKLNENRLRKIVKESVEGMLFENTLLSESMSLPRFAKKVFWNGNETMMVLGTNERWYQVFPNYHDAYCLSTEQEDKLERYADVIKRAYAKHNMYPDIVVTTEDGSPIIADGTGGKEQFFNQLKVWLEKRGIYFKKDIGMYFVWQLRTDGSEVDGNYAKYVEEASKMTDVTEKVLGIINGDMGKSGFDRALSYLKNNSIGR